jgi:hypothetical protein
MDKEAIRKANPFPQGSRLYQIYAAHQSARPKAENPAWQHTHRDLAYVLDALIQTRDALMEARRWIGDGDLGDGMHRDIWTPRYAAAVDQVDGALSRQGEGA